MEKQKASSRSRVTDLDGPKPQTVHDDDDGDNSKIFAV